MTDPVGDRAMFGARMREARRAASFSQTGVAAQLASQGMECTKQTVSAWEVGRNAPDPHTLKRLCRLYNCTADSLLWSSASEVPGHAGDFPPALLRRIAALDPEQRAGLSRSIETILDMLAPAAAANPASCQTAPGGVSGCRIYRFTGHRGLRK